MWQEFNNNPTGRRVGDCAVRAVSVALGISWEDAYALIAAAGFAMGDVMASNSVWGALLRKHGYSRMNLPDECPDCYTAEDFVRDHPHGTYVLGFGNHVATAIDGVIYDAWDSRNEIPQYVWYRKD